VIELLRQIRTTQWVADLLETHFDFDLARADPIEPVRLANGEMLTPIAGDNSGGTYLYAPSEAVVYAGSEGEVGLIADDLCDALALVVGLPSLHDALSRPLGDDLHAWLAQADEERRSPASGLVNEPIREARTPTPRSAAGASFGGGRTTRQPNLLDVQDGLDFPQDGVIDFVGVSQPGDLAALVFEYA
jgi:hypothetical protein